MRTLLLLALAGSAFASQALILNNTQTAANSSIPAQAASGAVRIDGRVYGINAAAIGHPFDAPMAGLDVQWTNGQDGWQFSAQRTPVGACILRGLATHLTNGFYFRYQMIPRNSISGIITCQAWDETGAVIDSKFVNYMSVSGTNSNGITLSSAGSGIAMTWGFLHVYTTTVTMTERMPVNADTTTSLVLWKFNGNGTDSSGNGYTADLTGSPSFDASAPGQTLILPVAQTSPTPTWTDRRTLRVGVANALSANASAIQNFTSASPACAWTLASTYPVSGLSLPFDNASSCTPNVTPNAFGDYLVQLCITDTTATQVCTSFHYGAVVMSSGGVVTPTDAGITKVLGPMIALGWNDWGLMDERQVFSQAARRAVYQVPSAYAPSYSLGNPSWDTPQTGTVDFYWGGVMYGGSTATTLTADITSTATSIPIANASLLELGSFPTKILISTNGSYAYEEIEICATTATSGAATLTVCYDGRGKAYTDGGSAAILGPTAFTSGTPVGQALVKGTGTTFTGGQETLCQAGAGPSGPITYNTGTVTATANSATLTGSGTTWASPTTIVGDSIRIQGTHSGTPFIFYAYVAAVGSTTGITMSRVYPATADTASGLTYQIVRTITTNVKLPLRRVVTGFPVATFGGTTSNVSWGLTSCTSNTQAFFNPNLGGHGVVGYDGQHYTSQPYSFEDSEGTYLNNNITGGVNFYGEDVAWYSLWQRSGLAEPQNTAEMIADHWVRFPSFLGGVPGIPPISPLYMGGGVMGATFCVSFDPNCALDPADVRGFWNMGKYRADNDSCTTPPSVESPSPWDTREGGYLSEWLSMGALLDPDYAMYGWQTSMPDLYTLESDCKGADDSWANSAYFNTNNSVLVTFIDASDAGAGVGIPAGYCKGRASGNFTITGNTLTASSGTFSSNSAYRTIVLNDANGNRVTAVLSYVNSTTVTISVAWPGLSTGTWLQLEHGSEFTGMTTWGNTPSSAGLNKNYECTWNSSISITLERPWVKPSDATSPGTFIPYYSNLAGFGQQPFMLGIKAGAFSIASYLDALLGTDFTSLGADAGTWVVANGYNPGTGGINYGRVFQSCEPYVTGYTTFDIKQPGCSAGDSNIGQVLDRMQISEVSNALRLNATDNLAKGNEIYNKLWCSSLYNASGMDACDASSPGDQVHVANLSDVSMASSKWPGFFFGIGMSHQWPAFRQEAPSTSGVSISGAVKFSGAATIH